MSLSADGGKLLSGAINGNLELWDLCDSIDPIVSTCNKRCHEE